MLNDQHKQPWSAFYQNTVHGQKLDEREMAIAGLAASMALNCHPCTKHYLKTCAAHDLDEVAIQDVLAKVMAVAAGQKNIQFDTYQNETGGGKSCCS
jgi:alkylhydroperoxidase/carboxymuconolactone decarboxylase family protein YurZ